MPYKPSRVEMNAYFFVTMPNLFVDAGGRSFYKSHVTVHDLACPNVLRSQGIELKLKYILAGPNYLMKRFGLEVEPPIKYCQRCLKGNRYSAITPEPDITQWLKEVDDEIIGRAATKKALNERRNSNS